MGRSVWSGPGQFRLDAGVSRWIDFSERWKIQPAPTPTFADTPFFSNPNTDINGQSFGLVSGRGHARG